MKRYVITIIKISLVLYIAILFLLLFVRNRGNWWTNLSVLEYAMMHINLVPFKTIGGYIDAIMKGTMNVNIPLENIFGNLIMFLPAGMYLPLFCEKVDSIKKLIIYMLQIFLLIELGQFLTKRGSFDIDDLILNLAGAVIGYLLWRSRPVQKILDKMGKEKQS